jgi:hypothetical protein
MTSEPANGHPLLAPELRERFAERFASCVQQYLKMRDGHTDLASPQLSRMPHLASSWTSLG